MLLNQFPGLFFHFIGEGLHIVGAGKRIHCIGETAFESHDLLCAKRDARSFFCRQAQCFIVSIGVEGLCAAEHSRHGLYSYARDIVERLLRSERAAAGLRMEAEHLCFWIGSAEFFHHLRPHAPGCAEFGHFFKKIIMRIEEERQSLAKYIDVQTLFQSGFHVSACHY